MTRGHLIGFGVQLPRPIIGVNCSRGGFRLRCSKRRRGSYAASSAGFGVSPIQAFVQPYTFAAFSAAALMCAAVRL